MKRDQYVRLIHSIQECEETELLECLAMPDQMASYIQQTFHTTKTSVLTESITSKETLEQIFAGVLMSQSTLFNKNVLPLLIVYEPSVIKGIEDGGFYYLDSESRELIKMEVYKGEVTLSPLKLRKDQQALLAVGYCLRKNFDQELLPYEQVIDVVKSMEELLTIHGGFSYFTSCEIAEKKVSYLKTEDRAYLAPNYILKEIKHSN